MVIAFLGAMLGVVMGVWFDRVSLPESRIITLSAIVTGCMMVLLFARPSLATNVVSGLMSVYLVFHINAGAIYAFAQSQQIVLIIPYVIWFFLLVIFHDYTNFGFYRRTIGILVGLGPLPICIYVLTHSTDPDAIAVLDVIVTFLFSYLAYVLIIGMFTRNRDEETSLAATLKEAERSADLLRISDERFQLIGLATNDLVWDADLRSGKTWWNEALQEFLGPDQAAAAADLWAWKNWIHPKDRDRVAKSLEDAIRGSDKTWTSEYRVVSTDQQTYDVVTRSLILRDAAGVAIRWIGSATDVTELKNLENKLRQSQKMEAVGQLSGGIAHDFNNLLTIIVGNAETLSELTANDPRMNKLAKVTLQAAERGAALTRRLLSFARRQSLEPQRVDPGKLLSELDGLIRRTIPEDIEISITADADVSPIEVDPVQLENVILNLIINARDAMPTGGLLTLEASNATPEVNEMLRADGGEADHYVTITVSDTGCGMPTDIVEHAFEPFFTTKEVGKGSGLGLSMVWGFVQQSAGFAQIQSAPGAGTSVRLHFPAANGRIEPATTPVSNHTGTQGHERVLVVEDEALVRQHVVAQLKVFGYQVTEAASALQAYEIIKNDPDIDLLLTDMVMPGGMNGKQLADAALQIRPDLKVLFTTGYTEDAIFQERQSNPRVHLLQKPYRRGELAR